MRFPIWTSPQSTGRSNRPRRSYPYACMGTCPFSLAVTPPPLLLEYPRRLPAIFRANLRLRYYESSTRSVGGRFRTSTPSIKPPMGPTSWLICPVPVPYNLSSDGANLRSRNYTQTFLHFVSLSAKKLFWWLFDSPFQLLPWSLDVSTHKSLFAKKFEACFLFVTPYESNWTVIDGQETKQTFFLMFVLLLL